MKKILLSILIFSGMLGLASASTHQVTNELVGNAQCKYNLLDARAGLNEFTPVRFVPFKDNFGDSNRQMGLVLYHNPKSLVPDSLDAMAMVLLDRRMPDRELTFIVTYIGPKQSIVFKRETKDNGKRLGPCFERSVEDNSKK